MLCVCKRERERGEEGGDWLKCAVHSSVEDEASGRIARNILSDNSHRARGGNLNYLCFAAFWKLCCPFTAPRGLVSSPPAERAAFHPPGGATARELHLANIDTMVRFDSDGRIRLVSS